MAKRGQVVEKIDEERLKGLLAQLGEDEKPKTKITIQRKRVDEDDDDESYLNDL